MKLPIALCVVGSMSSAAAQTGVMTTEAESLDGNQHDFAASVTDLTAVLEPGDERAYAALGTRS